MSAGYAIYSLDWPRFREMVDRPSPHQLNLLARILAGELEERDGEFKTGDPIRAWPRDRKGLMSVVARRLALPDWYGDLSRAGRGVWEKTIFTACAGCRKLGLRFRVEGNGVYWDVIKFALTELRAKPETVGAVALSAFGNQPYRFHPPADRPARVGTWDMWHSMHPPDEVRRMLAELQLIGPVVARAKKPEVRAQYADELLPAIRRVADRGRLLFVHVST